MKFTKRVSQTIFFAVGAGSRGRRWVAICGLLVATVICLAQLDPRRAQAARGTTLQGEAAVAHLKAQGLYDSLQQAMRAARGGAGPSAHPAPISMQQPPAGASAFTQLNKLSGVGSEVFDRFGRAVAVDGETVVVGVPQDNVLTSLDQGSVYVFVRTAAGFTLQQQLTAPGALPSNFFGHSVAISGGTLVVGAYGHEGRRGAAYVYVRSGASWTLQQKLTAGDRQLNDEFGCAVAIDGDTIAVGAPMDDIGSALNQGSTYIFTRTGTTWNSQAKLIHSVHAEPNARFGAAVSLSGNTIAIGAPFMNVFGKPAKGAAYIYARSGTKWFPQEELIIDAGEAGDNLGSSIALSGDTVVVGAPMDDVFGVVNQGAAYMWRRSGTDWFPHAELHHAGGAANDNFGFSVGISDNLAVAGAHPRKVGANAAQGAIYVFERSGQSWPQRAELTASDGAGGDALGVAVAISHGTIVAGASGDDTGRGSAYVFERLHKLLADDAAASARFGRSVATSGDTVVVGANLDDIGGNADQGAAYVFVRSGAGYSFQQKLVAGDGAANDQFGERVAISGGTIVVGVRSDDVGANADQGSAYVFVRSGAAWIQQQKLVAGDGSRNDGFGNSVAIEGGTLVVGAHLDDVDANDDQGSAYVFVRSGASWSQQQKLIANDGAANDQFGASVAISGETTVVGANLDDIGARADQGSAYVFVRSGATWSQQRKLITTDGAAGDAFGGSVAISGETVVIGAGLHDIGASANHGSAYIFKRSGANWALERKLTASDGARDDRFGVSVAISGETVVVGADFDDLGSAVNQGSAYLFARSGASWVQRAKLTASNGSAHDNFGDPVAISGKTIVIGAVGAFDLRGAAYVLAPPASNPLPANTPPAISARLNPIAGKTASAVAIGDGQDAEIALPTPPGAAQTERAARCHRSVSWITPANHVFTHAGGEGIIRVATSDGCEWAATSEADWILVSSSASDIVTFTVAENPGKVTRAGALNIAGRRIVIAQSAPLVTVSAASFAGEAVAPDSIVAAFGHQLARTSEAATERLLPTTLGGTRVRVRDSAGRERFAPLFSVSPTQINFQIPPGTSPGSALVTILNEDEMVAAGAAQIEMTAPGLFSADSSGKGLVMGFALRVRANGSQSHEPIARYDEEQKRFVAIPIDPGMESDKVYLVLFGAGLRHHHSLDRVSVKIGGVNAAALFAGPGGELTGMDQLNVLLPRRLAGRGEVEVAVMIDGKQANTLKVAVK